MIKSAEESEVQKKEAKDGTNDILDFSSIKDIIKKDGLEGELKKQQEEKRKFLDNKKLKELKHFNVPGQEIFWSLFSELWLVKNATSLKWDIHKPDFELEKAFTSFLEGQGHYEKKIKILLLRIHLQMNFIQELLIR